MQFRIEDSFRALFPEARIGAVVVHSIDNTRNEHECEALLLRAAAEATLRLGDADVSSHRSIAPWREAYRSFGAKPSKYRSSVENLLRSARSGSVHSINPLVDLYNSVSLRLLLPCGGEDLWAVQGDIRLTRATGIAHCFNSHPHTGGWLGEPFVPLGSSEEQTPQPGEVIYRDDVGVICRRWNWREAERTKLTPSTTDAFLCIEALPPVDEHELRTACAELAALVQYNLGGSATVEILDTTRAGICLQRL